MQHRGVRDASHSNIGASCCDPFAPSSYRLSLMISSRMSNGKLPRVHWPPVLSNSFGPCSRTNCDGTEVGDDKHEKSSEFANLEWKAAQCQGPTIFPRYPRRARSKTADDRSMQSMGTLRWSKPSSSRSVDEFRYEQELLIVRGDRTLASFTQYFSSS